MSVPLLPLFKIKVKNDPGRANACIILHENLTQGHHRAALPAVFSGTRVFVLFCFFHFHRDDDNNNASAGVFTGIRAAAAKLASAAAAGSPMAS